MKSECVRDKRLDDVAVRAHEVHRGGSPPWSRSTRAFHSRTASAALVCMARIDSPPGKAAVERCAYTTSISGSSVSSASLRPDQSPSWASPIRSSVWTRSSGRASMSGRIVS